MPFYNTARKWALRALTGASLVNEVDDGLAALADDVAPLLTPFVQGAGASMPLPSAATAGRIYRAADWGVEYRDTGTEFAVIGGHTGAIVETIRTTAIHGYLMMNGQQVTTAHARLRQLLIDIGSPFGTTAGGDPLLPDGRDRMLVGVSSLLALGARGGAREVALTPAQGPDHTHRIRSASGGAPANASDGFLRGSTGIDETTFSTLGLGRAAAPHENMPPYLPVHRMVQV